MKNYGNCLSWQKLDGYRSYHSFVPGFFQVPNWPDWPERSCGQRFSFDFSLSWSKAPFRAKVLDKHLGNLETGSEIQEPEPSH
jgi:hypothetical protein